MSIRKRVYQIIEKAPEKDYESKWFDVIYSVLILVTIIAVILETVPSFYGQYGIYFDLFETITVIIFTVEYGIRLWVSNENPRFAGVKGKIRYVFTPMALIDLLAILPYYLGMFFTADLRVIRALRLFRMLRVFKIARYSDALQKMGNTFGNKKSEFLITLFIIFILLIISSSLMYFIENPAQPEAFSSIPASMWWGIATLTTVGYGDIYPVTPIGKVLGTFIALLGIGIVALPAGILGSGFVEEIQTEKHITCPYCKKKIKQ